MAVNLSLPDPASIAIVDGVKLASCYAGVRSSAKPDVLLVEFALGTRCAGVFTQNRFCAAPVVVCQDHLAVSANNIRAVVVNAGNANAGTGEQGLRDALSTCATVARELDCCQDEVLPMSTGVILEPLPMDKLLAGIREAAKSLAPDHWLPAAQAIMTTDTLPKLVSQQVTLASGKTININGFAKGAGMIRPNMATMLALVVTDAKIDQATLADWLSSATEQSFNRITVDGDTSTNDTYLLAATGASGEHIGDHHRADMQAIRDAVFAISLQLAQAIIRDGEGATKFVTVRVEHAGSIEEADKVAYTIAHSPLVKTALFASDPNLGRLLCAIGYAGIDDLDVSKLDLWLGDVRVVTGGARDPAYREADGQRVMDQDEITIRVRLARGTIDTTIWTCDLSHDYVSINADYRS